MKPTTATVSADTVQITDILKLEKGKITYCVLGENLVLNRLAEKARQELLYPPRKKNAADKASTIKHNPIEEFRRSVYRTLDDSAPTRLVFPGNAFAQAIADSALDIPGATKSQVQRLVKVPQINVALFGLPELFLAVVRMADMKRTPDIRSRALLKKWAAIVEIEYIKTLINERSVSNLIAAAGVLNGLGDWRSQKGGSHGSFATVRADDPEFKRVIAEGGREAQDAALEAAEPADDETSDLLVWWKSEVVLRQQSPTPDDEDGEEESAPKVTRNNSRSGGLVKA